MYIVWSDHGGLELDGGKGEFGVPAKGGKVAIEKWNAKAREWYEIRASSSEEELTISGF